MLELVNLGYAYISRQEITQMRESTSQMKFIDFAEPTNNTFHVCAEFELPEGHNRRPDIVLFVNGFPFAVIENKRESVKVDDAVAQMVRNQGHGRNRQCHHTRLEFGCGEPNEMTFRYGGRQIINLPT